MADRFWMQRNSAKSIETAENNAKYLQNFDGYAMMGTIPKGNL